MDHTGHRGLKMTKVPPAIILNAPKAVLTEGQQAVVEMLEQTLEQAQTGKINALAIVVCFATGYATAMTGSNGAHLNLGCDSLKKKILDAVEGGGERKSGIIRSVRS